MNFGCTAKIFTDRGIFRGKILLTVAFKTKHCYNMFNVQNTPYLHIYGGREGQYYLGTVEGKKETTQQFHMLK